MMLMLYYNKHISSNLRREAIILMNSFTSNVIVIIKGIPEGYVMTYGQIAKLAGSARGARQVVRVLHSMSKTHQLPWHRVVNAKGEIAIRDDEGSFLQQEYLKAEGVLEEDEIVVNLEKYRYNPVDALVDHGDILE